MTYVLVIGGEHAGSRSNVSDCLSDRLVRHSFQGNAKGTNAKITRGQDKTISVVWEVEVAMTIRE